MQERPHRLHAVAEARAVLVAGVGEGLVEADVLGSALSQHVHLLAALRARQLIAVVLTRQHRLLSGSGPHVYGAVNVCLLPRSLPDHNTSHMAYP